MTYRPSHDDTADVEAIAAICDEFEFLRLETRSRRAAYRGLIVNHKKVRRSDAASTTFSYAAGAAHFATTDSNHGQPIYPNRTRELTVDGPNQLRVADITYVAIDESFAYVAVTLDAWSASGGRLCNQLPDRRPPDA